MNNKITSKDLNERIKLFLKEDQEIITGTDVTDEQPEDIEASEEDNNSDDLDMTLEQKEAIYDLKLWSEELGVDLGQGQETVGNIIKFEWLITDGGGNIATVMVSPTGDIKISGHKISNFQDFEDVVHFLEDEYRVD